MGEWTYSPTHS